MGRTPEHYQSNLDDEIEYTRECDSLVTTLRIGRDKAPHIYYDSSLEKHGIVTEPNSILIDQNATKELIGRPAGTKPEDNTDGNRVTRPAPNILVTDK